MSIDQIRPDRAAPYRHRATGRLATVKNWIDNGHQHLVAARGDAWEWLGTVAEFWDEFIHSDLPDPQSN